MDFIVDNLNKHPELIPDVAGDVYDNFIRDSIDDTTYEQVLSAFHNCYENKLPVRMVAIVDNKCAGSVSLIENDLSCRNYSPWLAAINVREQYRNNGIGEELVNRIKEAARVLGYKELFLRTEHASDYYRKLGWEYLESCDDEFGDKPDVFKISLKPTLDLTTMIMIRDPEKNKVVVMDRVKSWKGLSFPGGHLEDGESLCECAIREAKEETGLTVTDLKPCGIIHWIHKDNHNRYLAFLFKTDNFSGSLKSETDEGKIFWMDIEELKKAPSTNGFDQYLPVFLGDEFRELYIPWDDDDPWGNNSKSKFTVDSTARLPSDEMDRSGSDNNKIDTKPKPTIDVAAALFIKDKKVLATQRGYGNYKGWWEFPGGKIEAGEKAEDALVREISEELDAQVNVKTLFDSSEYEYEEFHVRLKCFLCQTPHKDFRFKEHMSAKWLDKQDVHSVKWLGADLPVLEKLILKDIL